MCPRLPGPLGSLKMFLLSVKSPTVKLENIRIGTSLNIRRIDILLPRNNADVTHCEKTLCSIFKTNQSIELKKGQQIKVCLKMTFT